MEPAKSASEAREKLAGTMGCVMSEPKRKAMAYFVVRREIEFEPIFEDGEFRPYDVRRAWREVMDEIFRSITPVLDRCSGDECGPSTTLVYDKGKAVEDWVAAFFVAASPATDGGPECGVAAPVVGDIKAALDFVTRRMVEDIGRERAELEEWERRLKENPSLGYIQTTAMDPKTGREMP